MAQIDFIIPVRNVDTLHRTLSMLAFQKDHGFRAHVVDLTGSSASSAMVAEFDTRIPVDVVEVEITGEPLYQQLLAAVPSAEWVCFLSPDVDLTPASVKRMSRCIDDHDGYDVFHWNLADPFRKYRLKTRPDKLFTLLYVDGGVAPLSSFVFRAQALREAFEADPEAACMDLSTVFVGAKKTAIRSARWERIGYTAPAVSDDPSQVEKDVRARLSFFQWSERYFGEEHPLGTGDRLKLYATELARLYPSFTYEELKENLNSFPLVNGPIRKMRAASALKAALKVRQESLK